MGGAGTSGKLCPADILPGISGDCPRMGCALPGISAIDLDGILPSCCCCCLWVCSPRKARPQHNTAKSASTIGTHTGTELSSPLLLELAESGGASADEAGWPGGPMTVLDDGGGCLPGVPGGGVLPGVVGLAGDAAACRVSLVNAVDPAAGAVVLVPVKPRQPWATLMSKQVHAGSASQAALHDSKSVPGRLKELVASSHADSWWAVNPPLLNAL